MKIGLLPLARPTFDVAYAEEKLAGMLARLDETGHTFVGPRNLLLDPGDAHAALTELGNASPDRILVLQVTFTDAALTVEASALGVPLAIWAVPEPRGGGRLRLNAFCGLNLASHALGLNSQLFCWAYGAPHKLSDEDLENLLTGSPAASRPVAEKAEGSSEEGARIAASLAGKRIARIGEHPTGFDTCAYSSEKIEALAGVQVEAIELDRLFADAGAVAEDQVGAARKRAGADLSGLDDVDQAELDRSLRLQVALRGMRERDGFDAFAIRCWPEMFTVYGGAVCGPVSMMGEARVPCACEADVYGALTQLILQEAAQASVFLTDLVDVDCDDDSAVIWHCGQAPISMRDPDHDATAAIHTNRRMPLLYQFALKPGRVTLMRISQAFGETKMILAGAEMLRRPMAFTGTSGVLRFDRPAGQVLPDIIACGLEHHMAVTYGEHRPLLRQVAAAMSLPVLEL